MRKKVRQRRRSLSPEEQDSTARLIAETALSGEYFSLGQHLALYMDADGEAGTRYLLEGLLAKGKSCYLPVLLTDTTTLEFRLYQPDQPLTTNFFGLLEPDASAETIAPRNLDTVFMPLVAFDDSGNRLGMGKGYYDRTFDFLHQDRSSGPRLIGLAHECQRVRSLEAAEWDVPLEGVITGRQFYRTQ